MYIKLILYLLSIQIFCLSNLWAAQKKFNLVLVHSYASDDVCGRPQYEGVLKVLRRSQLYDQMQIINFYMDTKATYTTREQIIMQAQKALEVIAKNEPNVVVTFDDAAFAYVGLKLVGDPHISVVFTGLNGQPEDYDRQRDFMLTRARPGYNVTGVYEKLYIQKSVNVLQSICPRVKRLIAIVDSTITGNAIKKQIALETKNIDVDWKTIQVKSYEEYQNLVLKINKQRLADALYPVALSLPSAQGQVTFKEIFKWTIEHSKLPELAVNYYFCSLGLFGGAAVDFCQMGMQAGEKVLYILQGKKAGDLSIEDAREYAIVFNRARARMLKIGIPKEILLAGDVIYEDIALLP